MIKDKSKPILGLNTYQGVIGGALTTNAVSYETRKQDISKLLKKLRNPNDYDTYKRSRGFMTFNTGNPELNAKKVYVLNEAFCAEKDVGSASRCRISPEGEDWGIFKSSGLIISTGKQLARFRAIIFTTCRYWLFGLALLSQTDYSGPAR